MKQNFNVDTVQFSFSFSKGLLSIAQLSEQMPEHCWRMCKHSLTHGSNEPKMAAQRPVVPQFAIYRK